MHDIKLKYNNEMISGALFAAVAGIIWFLLPGQIATMEKSAINARTIPQLVTAGLFLCSVGLFLQGLFLPKKTVEFHGNAEKMRKELRSVVFAAMLLIYGILFPVLGYIVDTVLLVTGLLFFYYCRKWWYYAIAVAAVFIVYGVFSFALNVNLPGLW